MVWQDISIGVVNVFIIYALIPQILDGFKKKKGLVNLQTSLIIMVGMYVLSFTFFTLKLYFSTTMLLISGTLWAVILYQKIKYG